MSGAMTVGAVDVHYPPGGGARAALVVSSEVRMATTQSEHVVLIKEVAPYEPGAFFLRELPCIGAVLAAGPPLDLLVVDGYATLDPAGRAGLGMLAAQAFSLLVIGVAKTPFRAATHAAQVVRGTATRPLFVTTAGSIDITQAARVVSEMAGPNRIPTALAKADRLARGKDLPRS